MEITEKTNRSHFAISHHLQIVKVAEIVKVLKEGAMNFNYFGPVIGTPERLIATLQLTKKLPTYYRIEQMQIIDNTDVKQH